MWSPAMLVKPRDFQQHFSLFVVRQLYLMEGTEVIGENQRPDL